MAAAMTRAMPRRCWEAAPVTSGARLRTSSPCSLLHIGAAFGHAELLAADFREHGDALADLFVRGTGETQPQAAAGIGLVGRPFRPGVDGDAGGECGLIQFQRIDI